MSWNFHKEELMNIKVKIIIDNLIGKIDDQGWDTRILEEIVPFRHDPYVAILT